MKNLMRMLRLGVLSGLVAIVGCNHDSSDETSASNTNQTVQVSNSNNSNQSSSGDLDVVYSSKGGHIYSGQSINYDLEVSPDSIYRFTMTYSNDDNAQEDNIAIRANGSEIGRMHPPQDTGDWGYGWANYVDSPDYTIKTDGSGRLFLDVVAEHTDFYGFRVDSIVLKKLK
jgi:hypothetical protein